ncbi:anthranilate synthase component I [Candidatus Methylomirabilis sp.]|uniref:anthranilate synthase component I n=1 Tax=Candidatus Methylomirabilis sp. TaxID=2032687 RepID=UPI002A6211E4|nr:anthranilate synthase component I [Candidatus Methylomirabilis sp.]
MLHPSFNEFSRKAKDGNLIPVYREILADMETPVSAFRKIDRGEYAFLLESVEGGEKWGRYSFLGSNPSLVLKAKGSMIEVISKDGIQSHPIEKDVLEPLKAILSRYRPVQTDDLPRFYGGMIGFLAYDVVRQFERLPAITKDDLDLPDALFLLPDTLLIFDNVSHRIKVVSNVLIPEATPRRLREAYDDAARKIDGIVEALRRPLDMSQTQGRGEGTLRLDSSMSHAEFIQAVQRAQEYVRAGDIVQAVISQRLSTKTAADPFDIYRALRIINPSPYMYYLRLGDFRVVGSSPEVLVRLEEGRIDLRPIAGTRPRGRSDAEDLALEQELLDDPKERAEHIMLVDLGRNDVGRVAEVGSVTVSELMAVERYSHVMHIVSNVKGVLAEGYDAFDLLRACFPAGTVTGAPKIRAMEIIEELEQVRRGPYAGAVGYFGFSGNMDTCITIRTVVITDGIAHVQVGAGIVADSDPEREYEETMNKAKGMLKAIEMAESGDLLIGRAG